MWTTNYASKNKPATAGKDEKVNKSEMDYVNWMNSLLRREDKLMSEQKENERYILAMLEQIDTQQRRAQELEQLVRDCLLEIKSISLYQYLHGRSAIELQDRAAALGVVPEIPN